MKISIITVGRIKEKYLVDAIGEYSKRIRRNSELELIELQDEKTPDGASEKEERAIKEREGERIIARIPDGSHVIALCIEGRQLTSDELSSSLKKIRASETKNIVFIIGGSLGLSDAVVKRADMKLSFSGMTFPHQLMKVILLEQIARVL